LNTKQFRRVVTGHNAAGASVVVEDAPPPRVFSNLGQEGLIFFELWNTRESPARIDRASGEPSEAKLSLAPPKSGTRIRVLEIPVEREAASNLDAVFENIGAKDAHVGLKGGSHASFHRTQTIDYGIVLDGEITLLLDAGETTLYAGDICVQRGTNHGWINRGNKPCRIAFILIDGVWDADIA
jgi:mannose-6-phosphate isomerase-like protein (cupin superfamily)